MVGCRVVCTCAVVGTSGHVMRRGGSVRGASPLSANVYLRYVFDRWANRWRRREAKGKVIILRYADDIVVGFEHEADARRFWGAMRVRLKEFPLALHPDKTRLMEFGRDAALQRKSRSDRMRTSSGRSTRRFGSACTSRTLYRGNGLDKWFAGASRTTQVPTNSRSLGAFRYHVTELWRRTLRRRSKKDAMMWQRITRPADAWLPPPRFLHPWPDLRFTVNTEIEARCPNWECRVMYGGTG